MLAAPRPAILVVVLLPLAPLGCGRLGYEGSGLRAHDAMIDASDGGMDAAPVDGALDSSRRDPPPPVCGDGDLDDGEACDDGNGTSGDGCENDCTPSCEVATDCDDGLSCNGSESCSSETRACVPGTDAADGTLCGDDGRCRGGECAPASCGDGVTQTPEQCDDGNLELGDGCDNDCTFSCVEAADCDDGDDCTVERCTVMNTCVDDPAFEDGSPCDRDGDPGSRDICLGASCVPTRCGDAYVDAESEPAEVCDDGNATSGDGCEIDCSFSCVEDGDCDDSNVCNGPETCELSSHRCASGTPPPDATPCPGGECVGSTCVPSTTDGGAPDATAEGCLDSSDCGGGTRCCDTCPGFLGVCIEMRFPCPAVMCTPPDAMTM